MSKALETLRTGLVGCALAAALFGAFAAFKANACTAMVTGDAAEIAFDRPVSGWEREYRGEGFSLKSWWMGPEVAGESAWATESLPIGNGWFGASVFGWVADERVQITHKALYLDPVYPDASQRGVATLTNTEALKTLP